MTGILNGRRVFGAGACFLNGDLAMGELVLSMNQVASLVSYASGLPVMPSIVFVLFLDQKLC